MFFKMHALLVLIVFRCINVAWLQSCIYTETDYVCKEIPRDYPAGLTSLILFVSDLGEINSPMFNSTNLTSVTSLTMTQAGVTAVAPQTFNKFHNLKTLILDSNHLSHVSSEWFSQPVALETLRLSNNKITILDHNSLFGMTNLLALNLSRNYIHTISQTSFMGISKLRQLDLSNNNLTNVSVDVLRPLNGTKIRLDGNRWNCSCSFSFRDFANFLRGLQNASLLENEKMVSCESPPELKGKLVWQEPECSIQTTEHPTTTSPVTGRPATGGPTSTTKPLTMKPSTLISLIVVLCALVLVICVLSVLYHRKRERKHQQTIKPSTATTERETTKNNRGEVQCKILEPTENTTTQMLPRSHQTRAANEMMSQIYHIYSSEVYQSREPIKRVSSAGPILCRTEMFFQGMETEGDTEKVNAMKQDNYYDGCVRSEDQEENVRGNAGVCEGVEHKNDGRMRIELDEETTSLKDEVINATETLGSRDDGLDKETDETKAGTSVDSEVNTHEERLDHDLIEDAEANRTIPHGERSTDRVVENAENLPYLTIGADPENQISVVEQSTVPDGNRSGPLRSIRRVLTWPPTAVQWKKQWVQNQHVLNVFPKLIFVTGYTPFQHTVYPTTLPVAPQSNAIEFLPENALPREDVRVIIDGDTRWGNIESCTRKILHFNAQESLSGNTSPGMDVRIISTAETWRSDLFSQNSPVDESDARSKLFTILHPSSGGSDSGETINKADDIKKTPSVKKKRRDDLKRSELRKQSRRDENAARAQKNDQKVQKNDNSRPHVGDSPKDASLEHTSIGLLHEVVENHGRWTRARWRQTQINKQKLKQQRQSTGDESR
ncbi:uncharacterized protein LOC130419038 isoform X1 [Triplophysa dalaica]|uniref:uncharacterized protein LOC130419038 isoform X1 n=1 Tax=Triplophysa dalaica TaxID=1582913 RepID=UPI0024DF4478|nr:uncharacterized protein LOC130419038 isoform X1 [Triplophysa dalaica]